MSPEEFRKWREERKLTQEEVGKKIGVTRRTVINWEQQTGSVPDYVHNLIKAWEQIEARGDYHFTRSGNVGEQPVETGDQSMAIVKRGAEGKSPVEYVRILDGIAKKENQIDAVIVVNIAEGTTLYSNDFRHKTGNIEYDQLSAAITGITSPLSQLFESGVASKLNHIDFSLDNVFLRVMPLSEENVVAVFVNANPSSFRLGPFDLNTKKEIVVVNEGYPT